MTPEEFYKRDRFLRYTQQTVKEMRVRSLDWMLGCYRKGTIRPIMYTGCVDKKTYDRLEWMFDNPFK